MAKYNVKFGDIWRMGQHRLLCGDSIESLMVESFLDEYNPKLCVTDPPYGIGYKSSATKNLYQLKIKNDHIAGWAEAFRLAKAPVIYVWYSFKHYDIVARAINDSGYDVKQMVVWVKNKFSIQHHLYHLQHEQCLVCIKPGAMIKGFWKGDRKQSSVWKLDSVKPKQRIHPTEKPVGVYTIPILNHTEVGDSVIDLFAGSGAIFEACENTGRVGLGIELCPKVCETVLLRMESKGCEISHEGNVFDQIEAVAS